MQIRELQVTDAAKMIKLKKKLAVETKYMLREAHEVVSEIEKEEKLIESLISNPNSKIVAAEVEDSIVGFLAVSHRTLERIKHTATFVIGIEKEYWGKGVSGSLMTEMFHWVEKNEINRIELEVVSENKRAIELYKKHGFEVEGVKRKDHNIGNGQYLDTLIMAKLLY